MELPSFDELIRLCLNPIEVACERELPPLRESLPETQVVNPPEVSHYKTKFLKSGSSCFAVLVRNDRSMPCLPRAFNASPELIFKCEFCGVTKTPEKREGPNGKRTLCNKCGLRWAREKRY